MNETEIRETKPGLLEKIGEALSNVLKNSDFLKEIMPALLVCIPPPYDLIALVALPILSEVFKNENPKHLGYQMNLSDKSPEDEDFHLSRRVGRPEDIANICLFLCHEDNDFVNGQCITADGGVSKKMIYPE